MGIQLRLGWIEGQADWKSCWILSALICLIFGHMGTYLKGSFCHWKFGFVIICNVLTSKKSAIIGKIMWQLLHDWFADLLEVWQMRICGKCGPLSVPIDQIGSLTPGKLKSKTWNGTCLAANFARICVCQSINQIKTRQVLTSSEISSSS